MVQEHLEAFGLRDVAVHDCSFNELGDMWIGRPVSTPDIVVAAANERAVRSQIEAGFPPLQIYATTGSSWQASLLRHIPAVEA